MEPSPTNPPGRHRKWWLAGYWLLLFVGSHLPQEHASIPVIGFDKVIHLVAYGVLAWLLAWCVYAGEKKPTASGLLGLFAIVMAYGYFDECTQPPVGRTYDLYDLAADAIGAAIALTAFGVLNGHKKGEGGRQKAEQQE